MDDENEIGRTTLIASALKPCPLCASRGLLTHAIGKQKFGIRCIGCPASLREVFDTPEAALTAWCKRKGTASAAGGRGTRGKCSWKKRRTCRRNLRKGRNRKKKKQITAKLLIMLPWVQALRRFEGAESQSERVEAWAALKALKSSVLSVPDLRQSWKLFQPYAPEEASLLTP